MYGLGAGGDTKLEIEGNALIDFQLDIGAILCRKSLFRDRNVVKAGSQLGNDVNAAVVARGASGHARSRVGYSYLDTRHGSA